MSSAKLGVFESMRKTQKIQLFNSSPNPFSCKEKGKTKSSLFLKKGTEGELEIELCRILTAHKSGKLE